MGNQIKIPAFEISQPIGKFYVGKIEAKKLIQLCSTDMDIIKESEYDIYQRKLNERRLPELNEYMQYAKATFPNGIILNSRYKLRYDDGTLLINDVEDAFFIIDGQHRVAALKYYNGEKPFEVCIIVFDSIDIDLQTEIFVTVNSEQKRVNPSVRLNLRGNESVDTPEKVYRKIAIALNNSKDSPFFERINFSDEATRRDDLKISLATFMRPLLKRTYKEEKLLLIKDVLLRNGNKRTELEKENIRFNKPLWRLYANGRDEVIYLMLLNYFTAVKDVFERDWNDKNSLLMKTSGYDALIMLFCDFVERNASDMSYDNIYSQISMASNLGRSFTLNNIGVGNSAALRLYRIFRKQLWDIDEVRINYTDLFEDE